MRRIAAAVVVIATAACTGQHPATGAYFLPPLVERRHRGGRFDPAADTRVEICRLLDDECGRVVARFSTTAEEDQRLIVDTIAGHFAANWHTRDYVLQTGAIYRIRVVGAQGELGHIDVRIVRNAGAEAGGDVEVVQGRTVPIRFRTVSSSARGTARRNWFH